MVHIYFSHSHPEFGVPKLGSRPEFGVPKLGIYEEIIMKKKQKQKNKKRVK